MPNQQSHATAIRAPGHSIRCFGVFFIGAVIVSGTVTADAANDTLDLAVTATVGSMANAKYGMEVALYTATGDVRGRTHIRNAGTISSSNLPVREVSFGTFQVVAGDTFQVLNEYRLHDRLVGATTDDGRFPPDYLPYSAQNTAMYPVCCSGGHTAAFVDGYLTSASPATYATVQRTGSTSYIVDPTSNPTHFAHLWTLPSGVAFAPGSVQTDADPVLRVNVGNYVIQHDFTDTDNGTTTTQNTVAIVCDLTHQPYDIMIDSGVQSDEQYGWHYTVRLFQDATLTNIPDGSLCILFSQERINGAWQSFGNITPGQEHILAVGYTHKDTNQAEAAIQKTYFDIVSPLQRQDEIAGYSKVMEQNATPDAWSKVSTLTTRIAKILLIYYYTTWIQAGFDFIFDTGYLDKVYPALYLQRSTPIQQLRELAHSVDARITCDPVGRIDIYTFQPYIPLSDRDAVTVTFILDGEDIIDFEFSRDHYDQVELMKTAGLTAGASPVPVFSLYPGSAPGEAVNAPTWERLICDSQDDLNGRTGRYGALVDNVFINADGLKQRAFEIKLTLFGSYNFFRFYSEYVAFSIDGTSNLRGIDLSAFRFWLKAVRVEYNGGTARTKLTLQAETNAPAGTTYTPPTSVVPPIYSPPPLVLPTQPGLNAGVNTLYAFNTDNYLYATANLQSASPTWARTAIPGLTGNVMDAVQDAFVLTREIVVTDAAAGVYTVENVGTGALATTLRATLRGTARWRNVDASFGADFVVVTSDYGGDPGGSGTWVCHSLDGGLTWSAEVQISALYDSTATVGLFVSSRTPGAADLAGFTALGEATIYSLSGTFANPTDTGLDCVGGTGLITRAWADSENSLFYGTLDLGTGLGTVMRKIGSGAPTDISPLISGSSARPPNNRSLHACPLDANTLLGALAAHTYGVFMSRDQGATWTQLSGDGAAFDGAEVAGNSADHGYLWGEGIIGTVDLVAQVVTDRSGNLSSFSPGRFVRIRG